MNKSNKILIAPSILASNFVYLADEIKKVEKDGADWLHIDVMDGHFVPNITIGIPVVESIKKITKLPLDVHLMIDKPEIFIDDFINAGADIITIHAEATNHLHRGVEKIKSKGKIAGVALNPSTSLNSIEDILSILNLVLIMSVNPGFGGQRFIELILPKLAKLSSLAEEKNQNLLIEVDGGISPQTAPLVIKKGANVLVAGTAIFKSENYKDAILKIREV